MDEMTEGTDPQAVAVLRDPAGDYYVLPLAIVQQGRVPPEYRADAERLVAAAEAAVGDDDTAGHVANDRLTTGQAITLGTFLIVTGNVAAGQALLQGGFGAAMKGSQEVQVRLN